MKIHDVGSLLMAHQRKFLARFQRIDCRLAAISRRLQVERKINFMILCPICGTSDTKNVVSQEVLGTCFTVMQCGNLKCQHGFLNPIPSLDLLESIYSCDQTNDACSSSEDYISKSMEHYSHVFDNCIAPVLKKNGRLLDVGAGIGTFAAAAKKHGWDVLGLEFNKTAVQKAKQKFGIELFQGSLYELEKFFAPKSFDLISFIHVFEHVIDPISYVKYIAQFLKANGCIFLALPNIGSDDFHKYGSTWTYLHIPAHISYFTCISLDQVFLDKVKLDEGKFQKEFQNTFPSSGMKEGEAITAIYRLIMKEWTTSLEE